MGTIRHHGIVVTGDDVEIESARELAVKTFLNTKHFVTEVTNVAVNGYASFFVAPDGSKEGWNNSNEGDIARAQFFGELKRLKLYVDAVEIEYGGDFDSSRIVSATYV